MNLRRVLAGLSLLITAEKGSCQDLARLSSDLFKYVNDNGGFIHPGLSMGHISHDGVSVRGVITTVPLEPDEPIMKIPSKVWMIDKHIQSDLDISDWANSCGFNEQQTKVLRHGAAIVREKKSGSASFFAPYLEGLPSSKQLRASMPRLAKHAWLRDFRALLLLHNNRVMQKCFERHKGENALLADLTWEEVETTMFDYLTRSFSLHDKGSALVPVLDQINTDVRTQINTRWDLRFDVDGGFFDVFPTAPIAAGEELLNSYCDKCSNSHMLDIYGIYFERNPNPLKMSDARRVKICNDTTLRAAAMAAFEDPHADVSPLLAPRCTAATLRGGRGGGPLRCSLSRLAWEYCSLQWHGRERPAIDEEKITSSFGERKLEI